MRAPVLLLLVCLFARPLPAVADVIPDNVRPTTPYVRALVETGYHHSATFRRLVEQLGQLPVLVHILPVSALRHPLMGELRLVGSSGDLRYLQISVRASLRPHTLIAALGHELQHALEIAQAPAVVDEQSVRRFYQARGNRACARTFGDCYETRAAHAVGRAVHNDLVRAVIDQ